MLSADGVVDEPLRDPGAEVPGFVDPPVLPGVLGEGGVLPPLLPGVPPPVCASANAGASPRAMTKPVTCSEKLTGTTGKNGGTSGHGGEAPPIDYNIFLRAFLARAAPMAVLTSCSSSGGGSTAGIPSDSIHSSRPQPVVW
jgi:hypothetical protein